MPRSSATAARPATGWLAFFCSPARIPCSAPMPLVIPWPRCSSAPSPSPSSGASSPAWMWSSGVHLLRRSSGRGAASRRSPAERGPGGSPPGGAPPPPAPSAASSPADPALRRDGGHRFSESRGWEAAHHRIPATRRRRQPGRSAGVGGHHHGHRGLLSSRRSRGRTRASRFLRDDRTSCGCVAVAPVHLERPGERHHPVVVAAVGGARRGQSCPGGRRSCTPGSSSIGMCGSDSSRIAALQLVDDQRPASSW